MGEPDVKPTLLYIYGPPASGKLTVATALAEVTEGGQTVFVKLSAPLAVLEERVARESRRRLGKLVDSARLSELVTGLDQSALHPDDLEIDTSTVGAGTAALYIRDALAAR